MKNPAITMRAWCIGCGPTRGGTLMEPEEEFSRDGCMRVKCPECRKVVEITMQIEGIRDVLAAESR